MHVHDGAVAKSSQWEGEEGVGSWDGGCLSSVKGRALMELCEFMSFRT